MIRKAWNYDRFIIEAKQINKNKFDYSHIKPEDIKTNKSKINILCNTCKNIWTTTIGIHIYRKCGCRYCSRTNPWNYFRFINRAREIHGDKYNYKRVKPDLIKNKYSKFKVSCNKCKYKWITNIAGHINKKYRCRSCSKQLKWTYNRFMQRAKEVHKDKYDYSKVDSIDIKGQRTYVPITCNICSYEWSSTIDNHINSQRGCPSCSKKAKWTFDIFVEKAKEIHADNYDYSQVKIIKIKKKYIKIPIQCKTCNKFWYTTIQNHVYGGAKCPYCSKSISKGEITIANYLDKYNIPYETQFVIPSLSNNKYDFYVRHNSKCYLIEFDGEQHFKMVPYFHKNIEAFNKRQYMDKLKTFMAIDANYTIIRIAYKESNNIDKCLDEAFKSNEKIILFPKNIYDYILIDK